MTEQGKHTGQDGQQQQRLVRRRVHRQPNFVGFIATGAVVGLVIGVIVANGGPDIQGYSTRTGVALIGGVLAAIGALAGVIVALILERLLNRQ